MKVSKAIEILSDSANRGMTSFNDDFKDAEKLGIEALKREKARREGFFTMVGKLLPGETPEDDTT